MVIDCWAIKTRQGEGCPTSCIYYNIRPRRNQLFYTYIYLDPRKPGKFSFKSVSFTFQPLYVGKGKASRITDHLKSYSNSNIILKRKLSKFASQNIKPIIIKLNEFNNEDLAYLNEIALIAEIGRNDLGKGPLCNLTDGGEGVRNRIFTPAEREQCRQRMTGKNNPMWGKTHTPEVRKYLSEICKARPSRSFSDEERRKRREHNPGGISTSNPVYKICLRTGNILDTYPSGKNAGEQNQCGRIYNRHADDNSFIPKGGFMWRYTTSHEIVNNRLSNIDALTKQYADYSKPQRHTRKIESSIGNIYNSITELSDTIDMKYATIWKYIKDRKPIDGVLYSYL